MDFSWISQPETWVALVTLIILEIVLGVDNIIFISILSSKLPPEQRSKARRMGLMLAVVSRILFLLSIGWVMTLKNPLFTIGSTIVTGKSLILLLGGLFLIWKATKEIHHKLEGAEEASHGKAIANVTFGQVIAQVLLLDVVFSIDSVITAVGMVKHIEIMVAAVLIAVMVMVFSADAIGEFVEKHPTVKMLALAFLVLIGVNLIAEGMGHKIPKEYTYFAMAFSTLVEVLNIRTSKGKPVHLKKSGPAAEAEATAASGDAPSHG